MIDTLMTDILEPQATAGVPNAGTTDETESYKVSLPVYEGPLDLLLHLIQREELDITAISLVQITDQYLVHIEQMEKIDADSLADFLVIAARLIFIKSRALLPRPPAIPGDEEEEEDPGEQLARQLREYKRYKEVAKQLGLMDEERLRSFVRIAPPPKIPSKIDLEGVTLERLLAAVREALALAPPGLPVDEMISRFTITIGDRVSHILKLTASGERLTFSSLLEDAHSRIEIIVTFLALLELLKRRRIFVRQDEMFGEIALERASEASASADNGDYEEYEPYREFRE